MRMEMYAQLTLSCFLEDESYEYATGMSGNLCCFEELYSLGGSAIMLAESCKKRTEILMN